MTSDEDNFRLPQRVCDTCFYELRDRQAELRQSVSRANQDTIIADSTSSMPNLPSIDFYMQDEIKKATCMLRSFMSTEYPGTGGSNGDEKIPRELLDLCRGVVFLTVIKAGFMFSGRYGTGVVIAKLEDGTWSAPSAVALTGMGWGLQVGAELTEVMLILASDAAVNAFKSRAQLSVGAELGVSVGPVGRSIESDVTAGNKGASHAFSYATSKGLFVGASLEASTFITRPDVNRAFYGEKVSTSALLSGDYRAPRGAEVLYETMNQLLLSSPRTATQPSAPPSTYGNEVDSANQSAKPCGNHRSNSNSDKNPSNSDVMGDSNFML